MAAASAHLLATQSLLGDTVGASERVRIARDPHDIVSHHLTALNLHLDLALRQSSTKPDLMVYCDSVVRATSISPRSKTSWRRYMGRQAVHLAVRSGVC
jgi:hypothetical protein